MFGGVVPFLQNQFCEAMEWRQQAYRLEANLSQSGGRHPLWFSVYSEHQRNPDIEQLWLWERDDFVGHVSLLSFVVVLLWPSRPHTLVSASLVTEVQG